MTDTEQTGQRDSFFNLLPV